MRNSEIRTTGDVARALGVTLNTVKSWIRAGKLSAVRLPSGHYRVPRSELERLLQYSGGGGGKGEFTAAARSSAWQEYESWKQTQPAEHHDLSDILTWVDSMLRLARSAGPLPESTVEEKAERIQRLHRAFAVIKR